MIVCIAFHSGDAELTLRLLSWIHRLSGTKAHDCLLVADPSCPTEQVDKIRELAGKCFKETRFITTEKPVTGWPDGANSMFRAASKYIQENWPIPFLWLEPDCVPLRATWLEEIFVEYVKSGKRYMGHIYGNEDRRYPSLLMSGVAVYPPDANREMFIVRHSPLAWDVDCAHIMCEQGHNSPLIRHLWGEHGKPPTFERESVPNTNIFSLETIPPSAAIWHRCKDSSLITLLREKLFGESDYTGDIMVVLPFCNTDSGLMLQLAEWMAELSPNQPFDALLSYQQGTDREMVRKIAVLARKVFRNVWETNYKSPPSGAAPQTWAWRHVALHVYHEIQRPWLWHEADMVPVKPDWLRIVNDAYRHRGRPFAGPKVKGMSHANGTSIYAWNTPEYMPRTLKAVGNIWDVFGAQEMMPHCADIGDVIFHAWGTVNGKLHPYIGGSPHFSDDRIFAQIPDSAVLVHRSKDGGLINQLRRRRNLESAVG